MSFQKFVRDPRSISSVVAVVLLVGLTVTLASVVGFFVLNMEQSDPTTPNPELSVTTNDDGSKTVQLREDISDGHLILKTDGGTKTLSQAGDTVTYTSSSEVQVLFIDQSGDQTLVHTLAPASGGGEGDPSPVAHTSAPNCSSDVSYEGLGTSADPYIVTTDWELQCMSEDLNAQYRLGNDIDASNTDQWNGGSGFDPIGYGGSGDITSFNGSLDGNGHTIKGLTINRGSESQVGLFGSTRDFAAIKDLTVTNADVTGNQYVGAVSGRSFTETSVENVDVIETTVTGSSSRVGGVVGQAANMTITSTTADVTVSGGQWTGGISGQAGWTTHFTDVHASGDVTGSGMEVGGVVGVLSESTLDDSSSTASVSGPSKVGGLTGRVSTDADYGAIRQSYAAGSVTATNDMAGGVAGRIAGGGTVKNSYSVSSVDGGSDVGGVAGNVVSGGLLTTSYAAGSVSSSDSSTTGGVAGTVGYGPDVTDSYWDTQTTGQSSSAGLSDSNGLTTSEMSGSSAESNMDGFDFENIWSTGDGDYPKLQGGASGSSTDSTKIHSTAPTCGSDISYAGSGTSSDPYMVTTDWELQCMKHDLDAHYALGNDIDLAQTTHWDGGSGFAPVGKSNDFNGSLDGNGYEIKNLYINRPSETHVGLFSTVGIESEGVSDLTLSDVDVTGGAITGGLGGIMGADVTNVDVNGDVSGSSRVGVAMGAGAAGAVIQSVNAEGTAESSGDYIGGFAGQVQNVEVRDSTASVTVNGGGRLAGGFTGFTSNGAIVTNVQSSGSVTGTEDVGGLVGKMQQSSRLTDSQTDVSVTGGSGGDTGGAVGLAKDSTIESVSATGPVEGDGVDIGGFIGHIQNSTTRDTYATGDVAGSGEHVAGYAGVMNVGSDVTNAYALGDAEGNDLVSGFVGIIDDSSVTDAYSAGQVTGSASTAGFTSSVQNGGSVSGGYWDTEASGYTTSDGSETGLTTSEMTGSSAESNMGDLDFTNDWDVVDGGYPELQALP